jgi:uncharacterized protein
VPEAARPPSAAAGRAGAGELEIVVKTTNRCNASCAYCSAGVNAGGPRSTLDLALATRICAEAAALVDRGAYRRVHLLWHGGEPLLLGKAFFRALRPHARTDVLGHQLQSNLLALDEEWLDVLEPLVGKDGLGTSCDPSSEERRFGGGPYLETWLDRMALLARRGWRVGCVYVLHRRGLDAAEDVYWFFRNLGSNSSVSLAVNPILPVGDASGQDALLLREGDLAAFLGRLARVWAADRFRLRIRPLDEWREWLLGEAPRLPCNLAGAAACQRGRCGVTPDGTVFGCGRAADAGAPSLGSLRAAPLEALLAAREATGPSVREEALRAGACAGCEAWPVCHGGCPHERVFGAPGAGGRTFSCADVKETLATLAALLDAPPARRPRAAEERSTGDPVAVAEVTEATLARLGARPAEVRITRPQRAEAAPVLARLLAGGHRLVLDDLCGWDPAALAATADAEAEAARGRAGRLDPWSAMADFAADGGAAWMLPRLLGRPPASTLPRGRCLRCAAWKFCRGEVVRGGPDDAACDVFLRVYAARAGLPSRGARP